MKIRRDLYEQMLRHGEKAHPEEACGFLLADAAGEIVEVVPVTNAAERMKAERPDVYSRDARHGYVMDPREQLRVMRDADKAGRAVAGIYHSHVEVGAYFSAEDKLRAAPDGEPIFPDAIWVVADVRKDGARGAKAFEWDDGVKDFVERSIDVLT